MQKSLKYLNIGKETKIYVHSWKERFKISITARFHGGVFMGVRSL